MKQESVLACSRELEERQLTIAFAESATAGSLCAAFAACPESGSVLKGGIVCYDAELKKSVLHVPADMIRSFTPESAEVTKELAERLRNFIAAEVHVAVTGLTAPGGSETPEKPVGTMFFHILVDHKSISERQVFAGTPAEIVSQSIDYLGKVILRELPGRDSGE